MICMFITDGDGGIYGFSGCCSYCLSGCFVCVLDAVVVSMRRS